MSTLDETLGRIGITAPTSPQPKRMGLLKAMFTGNLDDRHRRTLSRVAYGLGDPTALQAWQAQDAQQYATMQADIDREREDMQQKLDNDFRERELIARQKQAAAGSASPYLEGPLSIVNGKPVQNLIHKGTGKLTQVEIPGDLATGAAANRHNKRLTALEADLEASETLISSANNILGILDAYPDLDLGPTSNLTAGASQLWNDLMSSVGIEMGPEKMQSLAARGQLKTELFKGVMAQVAKTRGAISNTEMQLFADAAGTVTDPRQMIRMRAEFALKAAERAEEKADFIAQLMEEEGATYFQAKREWDKEIEGRTDVKEWIKAHRQQSIDGLGASDLTNDQLRQSLGLPF